MIATSLFAIALPFLGGIGAPELIIILVIVLILFGPKRLPALGKSLGKTVKSLKDGIEGKLDEDDQETDESTAKKAEASEAKAKKPSGDSGADSAE